MAKIFSKTSMINAIAEKTGFAKTSCAEMLDVLMSELHDQVATGATVNLTGLGSFRIKTRAARLGRNPATGAAVQIQEAQVLTFKPTKSKP